MIGGMVKPDQGSVEIGETIKIGYFAQEVPDMDGNQRVIDYIRDVAEYIPTREGKISAAMMLERSLFDSGHAVHSGCQAVRRREAPPLSFEGTDGGSECTASG